MFKAILIFIGQWMDNTKITVLEEYSPSTRIKKDVSGGLEMCDTSYVTPQERAEQAYFYWKNLEKHEDYRMQLFAKKMSDRAYIMIRGENFNHRMYN